VRQHIAGAASAFAACLAHARAGAAGVATLRRAASIIGGNKAKAGKRKAISKAMKIISVAIMAAAYGNNGSKWRNENNGESMAWRHGESVSAISVIAHAPLHGGVKTIMA
jgi:hypothetical protein